MLRAVAGSARVLLHRRDVGRLRFAAGGSEFSYTDDLLDPDHRVLGQVFEESPRGRFATPVGLPRWFANLLPEQGSGLRRYYAARFGEKAIDDARLLLTVGGDLPGAVTVEPEEIPSAGVLVEPAAVGIDEHGAHLSALAGAQQKMSLIRDGDRLTLPGRGETGDWIAKISTSGFAELAMNEVTMMRWAQAGGIDVPDVDLVPAAGVPDIFDNRIDPAEPVFVVRRFDRIPGSERVHIEDLAQVTDTDPRERDRGTTYDAIGVLIRTLAGPDDFEEYLRRLVAMVLMGNCDAHLKNWCLRYPDGHTPRLSPAYDLVSTTFYRNLDRRLVFTLGGIVRPEHAGLDAFRRVAELAGHAPGRADHVVRETTQRLADTWLATSELAPAELRTHIASGLSHHPLLRPP